MKFSQKISLILFIISSLTTLQVQGQSCDCNEYIYLNETSDGGKVHKFLIAADGTLTEVLNAGNAWYPGTGVSELPSPHGLGSDLNGFLYIGETDRDDIRRLTCDGQIIPKSEFSIAGASGYNFGSMNNKLYVNEHGGSANVRDNKLIQEYDLCTGEKTATACLNADARWVDWGFYLDKETGTFYSSTPYNPGGANANANGELFKFTLADFGAPYTYDSNNPPTNCVTPLITTDDDVVNPGDNELPQGALRGMTTDPDGNIYLIMHDWAGLSTGTERAGRILKYDPNGNLISDSGWDTTNDTEGLFFALGVIYSKTSNTLFISKGEPTLNCVQQYDLDLNDLGGSVGPATGTGTAKGISISSECCPTPNDLVIDTIFCDMTYPTNLFLQDLINCNGIICEGMWTPDPSNTGIVFNDCDNSITISEDQACGTFSLFSNGSNAAAQCGQFSVTINIETAITTDVTATGNQSFCPDDALTDLVATPANATTTLQWQMSNSSCTGPWTDIASATSTTYTPSDLSATTYYRVVASEFGGCASGSCDATSECITVTLSDQCSSFDIALTKSVDMPTASIGESITFTIVVENLEDAVTGATVNDVLPTGLTYNNVYTATTGTYDGTNWAIGNMAAGQIDSIQITATVDAEGVITNEATATINETETDLTNNDDNVCVSVPMEVCDSETININIYAETGLAMYQWYKDGVEIVGATTDTYNATETGTYTYTVDGAGPTGDCQGELCCPVIIEQISCCPPIQCLPIQVTKLEE